MRKTKTLISVGSRQDLALFFNCATNNAPVNWTVPKEAEAGDRIYFLIPSVWGPIQGYGTVDEIPIPSDDFGERYRADVTELQILEVPVRLDDLQERFPAWPYLTNAKAYTYVPDDMASDFVRFVDDYQDRPDWQALIALESREESLARATDEDSQGEAGEEYEDNELGEWEEEGERICVSIKRRRGQAIFRNNLRVAYDNRCAITGYNCHHSLEAAHIEPYDGSKSNNIFNGLLLRADIHTLFDLDLIGINQQGQIVVSTLLIKTTANDKGSYAYLNGQAAKFPAREEHQPNLFALQKRIVRMR